ncbi:hypothetical protein R3P38DRAFT_2780156 [Favolaschia claudopus]|uniref:Uncharacterized protein n=1 Tax=Favolaschia claudopus TaxID=2862362 RepID=A0AAW0BBE1_9AGAR
MAPGKEHRSREQSAELNSSIRGGGREGQEAPGITEMIDLLMCYGINCLLLSRTDDNEGGVILLTWKRRTTMLAEGGYIGEPKWGDLVFYCFFLAISPCCDCLTLTVTLPRLPTCFLLPLIVDFSPDAKLCPSSVASPKSSQAVHTKTYTRDLVFASLVPIAGPQRFSVQMNVVYSTQPPIDRAIALRNGGKGVNSVSGGHMSSLINPNALGDGTTRRWILWWCLALAGSGFFDEECLDDERVGRAEST